MRETAEVQVNVVGDLSDKEGETENKRGRKDDEVEGERGSVGKTREKGARKVRVEEGRNPGRIR